MAENTQATEVISPRNIWSSGPPTVRWVFWGPLRTFEARGRPHTATNRGGMAAVASWGWVWGPNPPGNTTNWSPAGLKAATVSFHGTFFFDSQMTQRKVHEMLVGSKRDLDFIEIFHGFIKHPYIV